MANSKEFPLPSGNVAFATVPTNPDTGNPRLSRTPIDVMCGFIPGLTAVTVNAFRANMPNGVKSVIDEIVRSIPAGSGGLPMTIRSTSAADVGQTILLRMLGANFVPIANTVVTLNGTTPVSILAGTPISRVNAVVRTSGDFAGNVLIENGGVTYGYIAAGQHVMRSSHYTVPAGFRFFLTDMMSGLAKDTGASVSCAMVCGIKPALSSGFGSLVSWNLIREASEPSHFSQDVSQGLTGPMDIRIDGTTSAASMDLQTLMSGVVQDLSFVL